MKKRLFIAFAFAIIGVVSLMAQTTALVTYQGGYFVKNGDEWVEYRPADKAGKWSKYEQYREDDTFFYVENKKCKLAIPKLAKDKIFIARGKNSGKKKSDWEIVYNTLQVYGSCPEPDGLFYCYKGTSTEYSGYFVRDNNKWREYRPGMKRGVWAEFEQTGEDIDYFIIESVNNTVYVPKTDKKNFIITSKSNTNWRGGYSTTAVYDRSAQYSYNFNYKKCFNIKKKGRLNEIDGKSARISLDGRNNLQIGFAGKNYNFTYIGVELADYEGKEAILITIDSKNRVWLRPGGNCIVECKSIGKPMLFTGASENDFRKIKGMLKMGTFNL